MAYAISKDCTHKKVGMEIFILDRKRSKIHTFNTTGTFIWQLVQKQATLAEIAREISEKFDLTFETALSDVFDFLMTLEKNELIAITGNGIE